MYLIESQERAIDYGKLKVFKLIQNYETRLLKEKRFGRGRAIVAVAMLRFFISHRSEIIKPRTMFRVARLEARPIYGHSIYHRELVNTRLTSADKQKVDQLLNPLSQKYAVAKDEVTVSLVVTGESTKYLWNHWGQLMPKRILPPRRN
jgi:hypothetical protein